MSVRVLRNSLVVSELEFGMRSELVFICMKQRTTTSVNSPYELSTRGKVNYNLLRSNQEVLFLIGLEIIYDNKEIPMRK